VCHKPRRAESGVNQKGTDMQPQPIQSEADLQDAFKRLEAIFQAEEGTPEFAEMQALVTQIEVYENKHHPISTASPSDTSQAARQRGMNTRLAD
jgi:HTH-type transcriptional regulator/antitoxin HigA